MKTLPEKFVKKGYKHILYKREGNLALYKRHSVSNSKRVHYEGVIITTHNGISIEGNYIEPGELYPSTSQWGIMGWTLSTLERAEIWFDGMKKQLKESSKKTK